MSTVLVLMFWLGLNQLCTRTLGHEHTTEIKWKLSSLESCTKHIWIHIHVQKILFMQTRRYKEKSGDKPTNTCAFILKHQALCSNLILFINVIYTHNVQIKNVWFLTKCVQVFIIVDVSFWCFLFSRHADLFLSILSIVWSFLKNM